MVLKNNILTLHSEFILAYDITYTITRMDMQDYDVRSRNNLVIPLHRITKTQ